jgi:hypothetical protein
MASPKVGSPTSSCQCSTGSWLATRVVLLPYRSSTISSRSRLSLSAIGAKPQSSSIKRSTRATLTIVFEVDPLACPRCGEEMRVTVEVHHRYHYGLNRLPLNPAIAARGSLGCPHVPITVQSSAVRPDITLSGQPCGQQGLTYPSPDTWTGSFQGRILGEFERKFLLLQSLISDAGTPALPSSQTAHPLAPECRPVGSLRWR